MFRLGQSLRAGLTPSVIETDLESILAFKSAIHPDLKKRYEEEGLVEFPLSYGEDRAHFHVTMLKSGGCSLAVIRLDKSSPDESNAAQPADNRD